MAMRSGRALVVTVVCAVCAPGAQHAHGASLMWDGSCGGSNWHTTCGPAGSMSNWSTDMLPGFGDDVSIPRSAPEVSIIGLGGAANSISCQSGLSITNGGQLILAGFGGTITNLSLVNSSVNLQSAGSLLVLTGNAGSNGGAVFGAGRLINVESLNGMSLTLFNTARFVNAGGADASLNQMAVNTGTMATNESGAMLTFPIGSVGMTGAGTFINRGTFTLQHDTNSLYAISPTMQQEGGTFNLTGGGAFSSTQLHGGGTFSGGMIELNGPTLRFQDPGGSRTYEFNGLSSISGDGSVFVTLGNGSDWRVSSPLSLNVTGLFGGFVINGAWGISLDSVLTNNGILIWSSGGIHQGSCRDCESKLVNASSSFVIDAGTVSSGVLLDAEIENNGTVTQDDATLTLDDNGIVRNLGEYTVEDARILRMNASIMSPFRNLGTFRKKVSAAPFTATIGAVFRNEAGGQILVEGDRLEFTEGGLQMAGGSIAVFEDAGLDLKFGMHHVSDGFNVVQGDGEFNVIGGGQLIADGSGTLVADLAEPGFLKLEGTTGRIGGIGQINNVGRFRLVSGTIGIDDFANFVNLGTASIEGGAISGVASFFKNNAGATTDVTNSFSILNLGTITNFGSFNFRPDANETIIVFGNTSGQLRNEASGIVTVKAPVANTATVVVNPDFVNHGTVIVESLATLIVNSGDVSSGQLLRGTWIVQGAGILRFPGHVVTSIAPGATVAGGSESLPDFNIANNEGTVTATEALSSTTRVQNNGTLAAAPGPVTTPGDIDNAGESVLGFMDNDVVLAVAGGAISPGFVCNSLNNREMGVVRPGGVDAPGPFVVDGNFNQFAGGTLQIELGGLTPIAGHDQVLVTGDVALDGILDVRVLPGYEPEGGEQFTILIANGGTITGQFAEITGPGVYSAQYTATSVVLTIVEPPPPTCLGDVVTSATFAPPADGEVDGADLAFMLGEWGANPGSAADIVSSATFQPPPDGIVDGADLAVLLGAWGACE